MAYKKIEVEKKFNLTKAQILSLTAGCEFISDTSFSDSYFDDKNYSLTTKSIWLRKRDDKFELKVPTTDDLEVLKKIDQYQEIDNEDEIASFLGLKIKIDLEKTLNDNGFLPFATFKTSRKKYKIKEFIIDLDLTDFGYSVGEIELMIEDEKKIPEAVLKINIFAKLHGLKVRYVAGKLITFLKKNSPEHFNILVKMGVLNA